MPLPTNTRATINVASRVAVGVEAVAVFAAEAAKIAKPKTAKLNDAPAAEALLAPDQLGKEERFAVDRLLRSGMARGKAREVQVDLIDSPSRSEFRRVLVVGIGSREKATAETLRQAAGALARAARRLESQDVVLVAPPSDALGESLKTAAIVEAIATGYLLASFNFEEYKGTAAKKSSSENASDAAEDKSPRALTIVVAPDSVAAAKSAITRAKIIAESQNFARTIASRPGNNINPPSLAKVAMDMARQVGLSCRVLDEKQMARLGMGGILGVGSGSATPPRMIVLEHRPRGAAGGKPLLAVGKSITFDTGGISIKPADRMGRMIFDKCGGMAVLGFMCAAARLKLPVPIVGILSSAENHVSSTAYRPGDILRMYNGVTVDVTNTDAEGRLVLGDALAWGIEQFKPAAVVDLATLTGGVIVALGITMAGAMTNNESLQAEIIAAGKEAGEQIWPLPLGDDQRQLIKGDAADIVNSAGRYAQPLQGGAFLSHFVPEQTPWVHLDIAGVADTDKELPYYAKGATGWGVRTLLNWATARGSSAGESADPAKSRGGHRKAPAKSKRS